MANSQKLFEPLRAHSSIWSLMHYHARVLIVPINPKFRGFVVQLFFYVTITKVYLLCLNIGAQWHAISVTGWLDFFQYLAIYNS